MYAGADARSAIFAVLSTSSIAACAAAQTGCAGHQPWRGHDRFSLTQIFRLTGPSMASITSRIDEWRPGAEISNPPAGPRRDVISRSCVKLGRTFERQLS